MVIDIKDSGRIIKSKEKVNFFGKMETNIKEFILMT